MAINPKILDDVYAVKVDTTEQLDIILEYFRQNSLPELRYLKPNLYYRENLHKIAVIHDTSCGNIVEYNLLTSLERTSENIPRKLVHFNDIYNSIKLKEIPNV
jgi:hypothetical protein